MTTRKSSVGASDSVTETGVQSKVQRGREKLTPVGKVDAAEPRIVTVTFNVLVPESTHEAKKSVFLTGNLRQLNKNVTDWQPNAHQMKKVSVTLWTVSLSGPEGTELEYKYTLGDWDHVELDEHCSDTPNRRVVMRSTEDMPLNIDDCVSNFHGIPRGANP